MVYLGKKIGAIDSKYWGSRTEAEFLEAFKGAYPLDKLKAAYKELPKPKKATKKKEDGPVLDSGKSD
jgi:hypothetical protein